MRVHYAVAVPTTTSSSTPQKVAYGCTGTAVGTTRGQVRPAGGCLRSAGKITEPQIKVLNLVLVYLSTSTAV